MEVLNDYEIQSCAKKEIFAAGDWGERFILSRAQGSGGFSHKAFQ